jgi:hypothetical protein
MISVEKITDKFSRLDEFLSILQGMHGISLDAFLKENIFRASCAVCPESFSKPQTQNVSIQKIMLILSERIIGPAPCDVFHPIIPLN